MIVTGSTLSRRLGKRRLRPFARVPKQVAGFPTLSFSFGNETVRRAMHSVFLYQAIPNGLDMAIVVGQPGVHDDIDPGIA